jgi:hypothetical protein
MNVCIHIHRQKLILYISALKMEAAHTSKTLATLATSTWCNHPRTELSSEVNHGESLKSVM